MALSVAAGALLAGGAPVQARRYGERALLVHRETGHRPGTARTELLLGMVRQTTGDQSAARAHWQRAHAVGSELGLPEAGQAAALLA